MKKHLSWYLSVLLLVIIFGTLYVVVQQAQRSAANWPQIQIARDLAAELDVAPLMPESDSKVNINSSLAPFTVIYDKKGKPVGGSGRLDGKLPAVPIGVLTSAVGHDYSAITWEPKDGVRVAAVSVSAKNYYVVSGRSLKEVEKNESQTSTLSAIGLLTSLVVLGGLCYFQAKNR